MSFAIEFGLWFSFLSHKMDFTGYGCMVNEKNLLIYGKIATISEPGIFGNLETILFSILLDPRSSYDYYNEGYGALCYNIRLFWNPCLRLEIPSGGLRIDRGNFKFNCGSTARSSSDNKAKIAIVFRNWKGSLVEGFAGSASIPSLHKVRCVLFGQRTCKMHGYSS